MSRSLSIAVLSDIHYAGPTELQAGDDYETRVIENPILRIGLRAYRDWIWLRHPLRHNDKLDKFLVQCPSADLVIANGDYAANVAAVGLSDDAAAESANECLGKLRAKFGERLLCNIGDHELGKLRMLGSRGGLRLASWHRCTGELGLKPFWRVDSGDLVIFNCVSTLVALPLFHADMLPEEKSGWEKLREQHMAELRRVFTELQPSQRAILFCHDPSALSFLWQDEAIRARLGRLEATIIGHLHSGLYLRKARLLAGMPVIRFFGHSVRKMSSGLNQARLWKHFRVHLCPSLAGIQLLKDGGYLMISNRTDGGLTIQSHRIPWQVR